MFKPLGQVLDVNQAQASQPSQSLVPRRPAARDEAGRPVLFDKQVDRDIPDRVVAGRDIAGRPNELRRDLTVDERDALLGRGAALREVLQPYGAGDRALVEAEIAAMMSGFRAMRQHGDDALAMIEVTCAVLRDFPLWAIAKACRLIVTRQAYVDGRKLDERYAPNDSEIHAVVEGEVRLYRRALQEVAAVLEAPVALPRRAAPRPQAPLSPQPPAQQPDGRHAQRMLDDMAMRKACIENGGWIGA